jgi:hypothetical protein
VNPIHTDSGIPQPTGHGFYTAWKAGIQGNKRN